MNQLHVYIYPLPIRLPSHCPPTHPSPSRASQCTKLAIPVLYHRLPLAIYFKQSSVYMSMLPPQLVHPPCPPMSTRLFSTSASPFLCCKYVHLHHFSRVHVHMLIYDICFSLSNLLHSVWQTLGPSTSLQMIQFHSFLWLSNILLYIHTTTSLSIYLSMHT